MVIIFEIIYFFLLFLLVHLSQDNYTQILSLDSKYPISFNLNNGNIFIVAEKGIYLYEQQINNLNIIYNFTSELIISDIDTAIRTTFLQLPDKEGGNIFCLANDKLYVFSSDVIFKTSFEINVEKEVVYYSINFHKKENKKIYYILGYKDKKNIFYLKYYYFYIEQNSNILISNITYEPKKFIKSKC